MKGKGGRRRRRCILPNKAFSNNRFCLRVLMPRSQQFQVSTCTPSASVAQWLQPNHPKNYPSRPATDQASYLFP
uniref:Uncharacterized protein n=1 Tax=Arundo donax TaxID=35708 RepID=A0A0A9E554_ARUDO